MFDIDCCIQKWQINIEILLLWSLVSIRMHTLKKNALWASICIMAFKWNVFDFFLVHWLEFSRWFLACGHYSSVGDHDAHYCLIYSVYLCQVQLYPCMWTSQERSLNSNWITASSSPQSFSSKNLESLSCHYHYWDRLPCQRQQGKLHIYL